MLRRLFRRRLHAPWTFRPSALWERIPPPRGAGDRAWALPDAPPRRPPHAPPRHAVAVQVYLGLNFLGLLVCYLLWAAATKAASPRTARLLGSVPVPAALLGALFLLFSASVLGRLADGARGARALETARCALLGALLAARLGVGATAAWPGLHIGAPARVDNAPPPPSSVEARCALKSVATAIL